jgi:hypothetical protein
MAANCCKPAEISAELDAVAAPSAVILSANDSNDSLPS